MNKNELDFDTDDPIEINIDTKAAYSERIAQKKPMEEALWKRISNAVPWDIEISSKSEDLHGIDSKYCKIKNGNPVKLTTVQLKFRQTGNDILMETILGWKGLGSVDEIKWNGRDVRWEVGEYFCVDPKFILRIVDASYLKKIAKQMTTEFVMAHLKDKNIKSIRTSFGDVRIKKEESPNASFGVAQVEKILVFIEPEKIQIKYKINI